MSGYELRQELSELDCFVCLVRLGFLVAVLVVREIVATERSDMLNKSAVVVSEIIAARIAELLAALVLAGDGEMRFEVPAGAGRRLARFVLLAVEFRKDVFRSGHGQKKLVIRILIKSGVFAPIDADNRLPVLDGMRGGFGADQVSARVALPEVVFTLPELFLVLCRFAGVLGFLLLPVDFREVFGGGLSGIFRFFKLGKLGAVPVVLFFI